MTRNREEGSVPTELEAAVLGSLWKTGVCTAYSIRQHFLDSPSPRWSGSAGAIYPLLRRLEKKGLVKSTDNPRGERIQRDYQLTRQGKTVFRRWLSQSMPNPATGLLHDPLRTRVFFLDALTKGQTIRLVTSALKEIRAQLGSLERNCDNNSAEKDRSVHFAARNALLITQARIHWLEEVLQEIGSE